MSWVATLAAFGLACVHVFAGKLHFLGATPRSAWLSAAGGISVAYVFLYLLPELAAGQRSFQEANHGFLDFIEHHTYTTALIGLTAFYGLERASKAFSPDARQAGQRDRQSTAVFWTHMLLLSLYNVLVGYLLVSDSRDAGDLFFFCVAMALHLLVMDRGLRDRYQRIYHDVGRWILAAALLVGWGLGSALRIPELVASLFTAFVAGGIVLNVLKEELPEERQSRFSAFLLGALLYSALLQAYVQ